MNITKQRHKIVYNVKISYQLKKLNIHWQPLKQNKIIKPCSRLSTARE